MGKNVLLQREIHVLRTFVCIYENVSMFLVACERKREKKSNDGLASLLPKSIEFVDGNGIYARNSYVAVATTPNTRTIELGKRGGLLCSRIPSHIVMHTYKLVRWWRRRRRQRRQRRRRRPQYLANIRHEYKYTIYFKYMRTRPNQCV